MAVGTTRGKRRLGRYVKPIRLRSGLKPAEVAKLAACSRQSVTRLEAGDALPRIHLFKAILDVIGATDDERRQALRLWEVADVDTATIALAEYLPVAYRRFRLDESEAVGERTFDTVVLPGMLQTPEYAAALSRGSRRLIRSDSWERLTATERRDRQSLVLRQDEPLKLHALVDEAVLGRMIGSADVMADQLGHLLTMMSMPNVVVQVVPSNFGAHGVMGPLTLLTFPEEDEPDSVYVESATGVQKVEDADVALALSEAWDEIADKAPSVKDSAEIIRAARDSVRK